MNVVPGNTNEREARLDDAVAWYLGEEAAGRAPTRADLLARHPDLARDLAEFLDDRARVRDLFGPHVGPSATPPRSCPFCRAALETAGGTSTCGSCGRQVPAGPVTADPFPVPHRVGRFDLQAIVGRGAFGTVYEGWDPDMRRPVAVKALRPAEPPDAARTDRFLREAAIAAQLHHPGIVRVYDVGRQGEVPYLVSEFVPGPTLAGRIRDDRPDPARAAALVAAVADALHSAHEAGVVHRDVKPSNVLLRGDQPLLTDFGLAHWDAGAATLTATGEVLGTVAYMSPEQARAEARERRTDVYSLGVVLYELLTGERPFVGLARQVLRQIEHDDPRPPRALDDRVPKALENICLMCLRKEPGRRYRTAAELAADLRRFRNGERVRARPVGPVGRLALWGRRNPAVAAAGGLAAALLLATAAVSAGWAIHAGHQADQVRETLAESRRVTAQTEFDRGLAEADRGEVGSGLLWMARSLNTAPPRAADLIWTVRANVDAWDRHLVALTDCFEAPPGKVLSLAPDGRIAWYLEPDQKTVRGWDPVAAQAVGPTLTHPEPVALAAVSSDGRRVACAGNKFGVRIWDAETGTPGPAPDGPLAVVGLAAGAGPGTFLLAINGPPGEGGFRTWDGTTLKPVGPTGRFGQLVMAAGADQRTVWTAGAGATGLTQRDLTGGPVRDGFGRHPERISAVAVSPDGRRLLTGGEDRAARLWDARSGRLLAVLPHRYPVTAVAVDPATGAFRTASVGDAIRVWAEPDPGRPGPLGCVESVVVSPDGAQVATGAHDRQVRLWTVGPAGLRPAGDPLPQPAPVRSVSYSPDGKRLAAVPFVRPGAQLWDPATGARGPALAHPSAVQGVYFSPDSQWAATAGYDHQVRLWHVGNGAPVFPNPFPHGGAVEVIAFSPSGRLMVVGAADARAHRWDLATGLVFGPPLPHNGPVRVASFHPTDHRRLLTAGEDGIGRLWDVVTGALAGPELVHGYPIAAAAFADAGRLVLTAGKDGKTRVWDVATGLEVVQTLRHAAAIRALAVSPAGRWAVTASEDGTARMWDLRLGRPIGPAIGHDPWALAAAVDPAGRWAVTAGADPPVRWHPAPAPAAGTAFEITRRVEVRTGAELDPRGEVRPLAPDEWRQRRAALANPERSHPE